VFADSAYRGQHFRDAVHAKGGKPRIVAPPCGGATNGKRWRGSMPGTSRSIGFVVGSRKIFGTWKRCYGLRRMRWRGLAKASIQVRLTAIAYNLKRTLNIVAAAARDRRPAIVDRVTVAGWCVCVLVHAAKREAFVNSMKMLSAHRSL